MMKFPLSSNTEKENIVIPQMHFFLIQAAIKCSWYHPTNIIPLIYESMYQSNEILHGYVVRSRACLLNVSRNILST